MCRSVLWVSKALTKNVSKYVLQLYKIWPRILICDVNGFKGLAVCPSMFSRCIWFW